MGHGGDLAAARGAVDADQGHAHEAAADGDRCSDARAGMSPGQRRLLAAMPLHAITTVHGEAGLPKSELDPHSLIIPTRSRRAPDEP